MRMIGRGQMISMRAERRVKNEMKLMATTLRSDCRAMGTLFEAVLVGEDAEHLQAVADAMWEEVGRIERRLSRFDPGSEISRINREAARGPVRVDVETFELLRACEEQRVATGGFFDVTAGSGVGAGGGRLILNEGDRSVQFARDGVRIDLGGIGKGYALEQLKPLLREFGVDVALVHGGTSSVLARGAGAGGGGWRVGVRDPFDAEGLKEVTHLMLDGRSLSCSAARDGSGGRSDIVDPGTGAAILKQGGCVVVADDGVEAEALSTACLAMGKKRRGRTVRGWRSEFRLGGLDAGAEQLILNG